MARMTGRLLTSARDDLAWENAWGAPAGGVARENAERGSRKGEQTYCRQTPARQFRVPRSPFRVSCDPIHQRAEKHHDAHDSIGGEEGGVQSRQVARPDEPVLPRDQRRATRDSRVVGEAEPRADAEHD